MLFLCENLSGQGEAAGIRIWECRGLDTLVVIPDTICGQPVTELAPYVFSARAAYEDAVRGECFWWDGTDGVRTGAGEQKNDSAGALQGRRSVLSSDVQSKADSMFTSSQKPDPALEEQREADGMFMSLRKPGPAPEEQREADGIFTSSQKQKPYEPDALPAVRGDRLEELRLPAHLSRVGAYAFYNCENLRRLELYSTTLDWGAGVFTGCYGIRELTAHVDEDRRSCLREVLAELRQTLELTYIPEEREEDRSVHPTGSTSGAGVPAADLDPHSSYQPERFPERRRCARLILPEFFEEAVENTPARILVTETHGCGHKYRNAFVRTQFQFSEYDGLFPHVQVQEPEELVTELALLRLKYPYRLEERYERRYLEYLTEHAVTAAAKAVRDGHMDRLQWLFGHIPYDAAQTDRLLEVAGEAGKQDAVSYLMDRKRGMGGARRRRFSL